MDEHRQLDIFKSKRQKGTKAPPALERATHIAIADLLHWGLSTGWWFSHIPSGELRTNATGKLLKRMGTKPGMADFMLLGPGVVCFLELKRRPNRLTEAQFFFGKTARSADAKYEVAYSYEEAEAILPKLGSYSDWIFSWLWMRIGTECGNTRSLRQPRNISTQPAKATLKETTRKSAQTLKRTKRNALMSIHNTDFPSPHNTLCAS